MMKNIRVAAIQMRAKVRPSGPGARGRLSENVRSSVLSLIYTLEVMPVIPLIPPENDEKPVRREQKKQNEKQASQKDVAKAQQQAHERFLDRLAWLSRLFWPWSF
jgi:hypothetical protein